MDLPDDIIFNILAYLPVKSLLRFKSVCKSWYSFISDPYFLNLHVDRTTNEDNKFNLILGNERLYSITCNGSDAEGAEIDNPFNSSARPVRILGSCNGLLLISSKKQLHLLNPYTQDHLELPPNPPLTRTRVWPSWRVYGLGYDSLVGDYKVIQMTFYYKDRLEFSGLDECGQVQIFSLIANSWTQMEDLPCLIHHNEISPGGKFLNGAVHWLGIPVTAEMYGSMTIVALCIGSEKFREVPVPDEKFGKCICLDFTVVRGWLCLFCRMSFDRADILVMKQYGVKESWCKLYTISEYMVTRVFHCWRLVCITKDDKIILQLDWQHLIMYDSKQQGFKRRVMLLHGVPDWFLQEKFLVVTYEKSMFAFKPCRYFRLEQEKEAVRRVIEALRLTSRFTIAD